MATVRKIKNKIRLECDCGVWVHEILLRNGKLEVESFKIKNNDNAEKKPKKELSVFEELFGDDDYDELEEEEEDK